jgi:perosamine synthetase
VTERTVAILVVHYAGYPADLAALRAIADRHGIALIEDCAHALGAQFQSRPIGSFGDSAIFSFQAIKHMTTVDGGALVLRDARQNDLARRLRWFGLAKGVPRTEANITQPGYKYNMHNVAAVIGLAQLGHIDGLLSRHRENGAFFDDRLADIAGIDPAHVLDGTAPSYWLYTLLCDDSNAVERCLGEAGIMASKLHRPNHLHSAFAPFAGPMPGLDSFYRRLIHVPCGWWVDDETRERIVDTLRKG